MNERCYFESTSMPVFDRMGLWAGWCGSGRVICVLFTLLPQIHLCMLCRGVVSSHTQRFRQIHLQISPQRQPIVQVPSPKFGQHIHSSQWNQMQALNRPISRYYSHLVAVRGRCSIGHVHAGTLGFTYMEIHTVKYILFESSDKSPHWTNPYHIGFRYEASLNFHTYCGQCLNGIYILLHIPLSCLSKLPAQGANNCHGP